MKKKTLAWLAAVAIVALVSAAFLRPAPSDFGFADELYTPSFYNIGSLELSGDTHFIEKIEFIGIEFSGMFPVLRIRIFPADGAPAMKFPYAEQHITVERRTSQGLEYVGEVGSGYMIVGYPDYIVIEENEEFYDYLIDFPYMGEPGEYTLTLRFIADGDCSVQFSFELRSTNRIADVALAEPDWFEGEPILRLGLRCYEGTLYLDRETMKLEQRVGDGYLSLTRADGSAPLSVSGNHHERYIVIEDAWERDSETRERIPEPFCVYPAIYLELDGVAEFDAEVEYRLTLEFVENADGSGERYILRLRVSFSGEG